MFSIPSYVKYTNQMRAEREELENLLENDEITEFEFNERIENQLDYDDWQGMAADYSTY